MWDFPEIGRGLCIYGALFNFTHKEQPTHGSFCTSVKLSLAYNYVAKKVPHSRISPGNESLEGCQM